jgi:hypothetical protein
MFSRIRQAQDGYVSGCGFNLMYLIQGGLLCSFVVDGTKVAFVSCHLTAHEVIVSVILGL